MTLDQRARHAGMSTLTFELAVEAALARLHGFFLGQKFTASQFCEHEAPEALLFGVRLDLLALWPECALERPLRRARFASGAWSEDVEKAERALASLEWLEASFPRGPEAHPPNRKDLDLLAAAWHEVGGPLRRAISVRDVRHGLENGDLLTVADVLSHTAVQARGVNTLGPRHEQLREDATAMTRALLASLFQTDTLRLHASRSALALSLRRCTELQPPTPPRTPR